MPSFIKTPAQEKLWDRAKREADKSGKQAKDYWAMVNFLYQKMAKAHVAVVFDELAARVHALAGTEEDAEQLSHAFERIVDRFGPQYTDAWPFLYMGSVVPRVDKHGQPVVEMLFGWSKSPRDNLSPEACRKALADLKVELERVWGRYLVAPLTIRESADMIGLIALTAVVDPGRMKDEQLKTWLPVLLGRLIKLGRQHGVADDGSGPAK